MLRGLVLLATVCCWSSFVQAQTRIPDELSCPRCTITLTRVATIGTVEGPASLPGFSILRVDGAGRYWVIHPPDLPLIFDTTGKLTGLSFRKGEGPGEFPMPPVPVPLPGDSTLAITGPYGRAAVLDRNLRPGRVIQLRQMVQSAVALRWPDLVFANGYARTRARTFEPLSTSTFAAGTEAIIKSFGTHPGEAKPDVMQTYRFLARAGDHVWVAEPTQYRLTEWTAEGTIARVLERKPSWFTAGTYGIGGPKTPPRAVVRALQVEDNGEIWVFISVPAPTWRDAWPKTSTPMTEISADRIRNDKLYNTIIEVIDPKAARVIARKSINDYVTAALPGHKAAIAYVDADDIPHYSIVRLALVGR